MKHFTVQTDKDTFETVTADYFEVTKFGLLTFYKNNSVSYQPDTVVIAYNAPAWLTFSPNDDD
jgi:hypothetical protein